MFLSLASCTTVFGIFKARETEGNQSMPHQKPPRITARGTTEPRYLEDHFADIVNLKNFGAVGDGSTDDTISWNAWKRSLQSGGIGVIPAGRYRVNNIIRTYLYGSIGNFMAKNFDVTRWTQNIDGDVFLNLGREWNVKDASHISPTIIVENSIDTTKTISAENVASCAYFTHTQKGSNVGNRIFSTSLITSAVSNAKGDNDVIACSNRAIRNDVPGCIGDCAGVGGRIDTIAHQKGCSMGAEFASHLGDTGMPCPSDFSDASTSKWATPVHITGDSSGSPATAAILIQGSKRKHSYWDGIQFSYSMFPTVPERGNITFKKNEIPNNDGTISTKYPGEITSFDETGHLSNTVAINMGSFSLLNGYPDTCLKMGYAKNHIWTPNSLLEVRSIGLHCYAHSNIKIKLDSLKTSSNTHESTEILFQEDGNTKASLSYKSNSLMLENKNIDNSAKTISIVLYENSFRPGISSDNISLGNHLHRFAQLYVDAASIITSDERTKTSVHTPEDILMKAWAHVDYKIFQYKTAVAEKGKLARLHVGVIAQQVVQSFAKEGLDAGRYGLLCHDKWDAQPEKWHEWDEEIPARYDEDGDVVEPAFTKHHRVLASPAVEAGDEYSIRYEEAFALECAYLRSCIDKMQKQINILLKTVEQLTSKHSSKF